MFNLIKRGKINDPFSLIDSMLSDRWLQTMAPGTAFPAVDIEEKDNTIRILAELPGIAREDVSLFFEDGKLTLSGEKKRVIESDEGEGKGLFHRTERVYGSFTRTFQVGDQIKDDSIQANFQDGVLTITMEREVPEKPQRKSIEIL